MYKVNIEIKGSTILEILNALKELQNLLVQSEAGTLQAENFHIEYETELDNNNYKKLFDVDINSD